MEQLLFAPLSRTSGSSEEGEKNLIEVIAPFEAKKKKKKMGEGGDI